MLIQVDTSALRRTKWTQYAVRFVFGGLITAIAGLIAKHYGPAVGGLFLAFPAIFPASVTLCYQAEIKKKTKKGLSGEQRGISAAGAEAAGTVLGSVGLVCFAVLCSTSLTQWNVWLTFLSALVAWSVVSVACWFGRKRLNLLRANVRQESSHDQPHRPSIPSRK